MSGVAVCTLVRGRQGHLRNLLRGLERQVRPPDCLVVARMGGPDVTAAIAGAAIRTRVVDVDTDRSRLPLARARNLARNAAGGVETLVMLDVDVIPGRSLVADYVDLVNGEPAIWSGRVDYLPPMDLQGEWSETDLSSVGAPHPARRPPAIDTELSRPELFWSLSFALPAAVYDQIGGFDERYRGYGAEDTDFARRAHRAGVALGWTGRAQGFHQYHDQQDPPRQHLADIVANARRFHDRWGDWPMEGWLHQFRDAGLIRWDPDGDLIDLAVTDDRPIHRNHERGAIR